MAKNSAQDLSFELTERDLEQLTADIEHDSQTGEFTRALREKHFGAGVPISYVTPDDPHTLVREYPDGQIVKESIAEREKKWRA